MSWTVSDQGGAQNTSGATLAKAAASTIPVGALVVVGVTDHSNASSGGSLTDAAGNTYTSIVSAALNGAGANGFGQVFWAELTTQLTVGQSITYTKQTSGSAASMAILSARGNLSPSLDSPVTASATGTGSSPSVTSGTPAASGDLFVACACMKGVTSFTVDSGHGWAAPPAFATNGGGGDTAIGGGNQVNAGTGTKTHAPLIGGFVPWADFIVGFLVAPVTINLSVTETANADDSLGVSTTMALSVTEAAGASDQSDGDFPPPPPLPVVRDPFDRTAQGRFIPGAGFRRSPR